jgi:hypothetical protein
MLRKVYPWLLPVAVSLLLVLAFSMAERVRRTTPQGKFNSIQLGMDREEAILRILGEPNVAKPSCIGPTTPDMWAMDEFHITIFYDWYDWSNYEGRVFSKTMRRPGQWDAVLRALDGQASSAP